MAESRDEGDGVMHIQEKKAGLSITEVQTAIEVMERFRNAIGNPFWLHQVDRNELSIENTDIFCRLKNSAISVLKALDEYDLKKREKTRSPNRGTITMSTSLPAAVSVGIRELRRENALKWKKVFASHDTHNFLRESINSKEESLNFRVEEVNKTSMASSHKRCYICKSSYSELHHFYNKLCKRCGNFNYRKRMQSANLTGKVALVTGGRIKIGYEVVLKLLRCGAFVIVTTRFPANAAKRYSSEHDYNNWKDRLHIYALDLRFIRHVEEFCSFVSKKYDRLDILIQNAAQTVRRPVAFYKHLFNEEINHNYNESMLIHSWDSQQSIINDSQSNALSVFSSPAVPKSAQASQMVTHPEDNQYESKTEIEKHFSQTNALPVFSSPIIPKSVQASQMMTHPEDHRYESTTEMDKHFPQGCYDEDHQQLDLRPNNSWLLEADQVHTSELVEVNLVNSIAPFIILSKLTPLLKKSVESNGYNNFGSIILVSAMEGKFNRLKTTKHPHTNCAKASLNMLVRTSAEYYRQFGLLLNAVDTGWVTDEDPIPLKHRRSQYFGEEWEPPIDCIDGASRILDPVFRTTNHGTNSFGMFFKDYFPSEW